jgi:hypothetical protein
MIESPQQGIIDYPPSPRPSLVDSVFLSYRANHSGERIVPRAEAVELDRMWASWQEQIITFARISEKIGVDYLKIQPGQPMIDCKPGSNRYAIFDDYKTAEYLNDMLAEFAPDVQAPGQLNAEQFLDGQTIDAPFVFKDISLNRGVNKFLVETPEQAKKLKAFLVAFRKSQSLHDLVIEEFIETPTDRPTSYRYTMTPTGTILAASLLSADNDKTAKIPKTTHHFQPLVDTDSPYYLGSPSITSNVSTGGIAVGLDFSERTFELAPLDKEKTILLEAHGIDSQSRRAPDNVTDTARKAARAIGPSIGLTLGIDIIQQAGTDMPHFLEANSSPDSINDTIHPAEKRVYPRDLKFIGLQRTLEDLIG